jgi:hypothetical protein
MIDPNEWDMFMVSSAVAGFKPTNSSALNTRPGLLTKNLEPEYSDL